jgi:two-component system, NtrC family, sensor kinase
MVFHSMADNVQSKNTDTGVSKRAKYARPMNRDFQVRFTATLLTLFTAASVVLAYINFRKEQEFQVPYDGAWWVERSGGLLADRVEKNGPAARAGIKAGDQLTAVDTRPVTNIAKLDREQYRVGPWAKATYSIERQGVSVDMQVILAPTDRTQYAWLRLIALIYLGIGLYVLLRRWTAPGSLHFYIFCLVSFTYYAFHYTGKLNAFDWNIYWGNVIAGLLQPALFLHFVLTFPERRWFVRQHRWLIPAIYAPGAILLGIQVMAITLLRASEVLRWNLDRVQMGYVALLFVIAAGILLRSYRSASTVVLRQQLKWLTRGTVLAITPFTLFYVIPYLTGALPTPLMKSSVLSLGLLPLTFGYAIFRYRLMDVDLIFKRGMVYTLAAGAIAGAYFAMIAAVAELVHARIPSSGPAGLSIAIVVIALLFDPVRKWIQEQLDRVFYRTRYDYRKTLIEFGRELSSETDLDKMLSSVVDRLSRTLLVDRMAIFSIAGEPAGGFVIAKSFGMTQVSGLDLDFLSEPRAEMEAGHLFFDNTRQVPRETASAQQAIAALDLNYYIPCRAQKQTIAVLGLGKTIEGDFLSSEDVELLQTLAGYLGIADSERPALCVARAESAWNTNV